MSKTFPSVIKILLLLLVTFSSCTKRFSEVSLYSNLQEGDSISVALHSIILQQYHAVNGVSVTSADVIRGRVDVPLPDSLIRNINALSITIHHCSDSILTISAIRLNSLITISPQDIMNNLWWQEGLAFQLDPGTNTVKSPVVSGASVSFPVGIAAFHFPSRPLGFQLFLRITLLVTLFILILIFTAQAVTQRFIVFSVALFLASLPLKIAYANYPMGFMILVMITAFIRNNPRRFVWQPIFYVLCVIYFLVVTGLFFADNMQFGTGRLNTLTQFVLFPVIFSMIQFTEKNLILLLRFFMWSAIVFCVFGLLSYAIVVPEFTWHMTFRDSKQYSHLLTIWPAHWHPSYISTILLMAIPVALYLRFHNGKKITIAEMLPGTLLPIVYTILAGARIGLVIVPALLGLGYLFYCRFIPALKWALVLAAIIAASVMLYIYPDVDDRFADPIRMDLRRNAIAAIKEKPLLGWGTGAATPLIQSEERAHALEMNAAYPFNQFHNQFLEDAVQFGIFGIAAFIVLFGWILWNGIRNRNFMLLSFFTIYILFCCTESFLYVSKGVVTFTFWLCFMMTNRNLFNNPKTNG